MTVESLRGEVVNRTRLARLFGAAKTTVDTWVAEGCPVVKRPSWICCVERSAGSG